jgi:hypothetical protein
MMIIGTDLLVCSTYELLSIFLFKALGFIWWMVLCSSIESLTA